MINQLISELKDVSSPEKARIQSSFFKTGKGEYGEGDIFIGITTPDQRKISKKYALLTLEHVSELLNSKIHEHRSIALFILLEKYKENKKQIVDFYLNHTSNINNWDLVDLSAYKILGDYLLDKDRKILYKLAQSSNLWEKRISIIATFAFIRNNEFEDTIRISKILLNDKHDLIQKAVGWMLREVGKKDQDLEEEFLTNNSKEISRTTLRYAIEKFNKEEQNRFLTMNKYNLRT